MCSKVGSIKVFARARNIVQHNLPGGLSLW